MNFNYFSPVQKYLETDYPYKDGIQCLNLGFIRLDDFMGSDLKVVKSARVSVGQGSKGEAQDFKLLKYLWDNKHTSPFEQVSFTFHVKCPIFIARQWLRHRTLSANEISARYTEMKDEFWIPMPDDIRKQHKSMKQCSDGGLSNAEDIDLTLRTMEETYKTVYEQYQNLLKVGVSREQARAILPVGIYTEFFFTQNLHNLFHFLELRLDHHAQPEIQVYSEAILKLIEPIVPACVSLFRESLLSK